MRLSKNANLNNCDMWNIYKKGVEYGKRPDMRNDR